MWDPLLPIIAPRTLCNGDGKAVARAKPGQRIGLQLDPRIALEAIILNRLERTPSIRRHEWLRSLLIQGFRSECQTLRAVAAGSKRGMTFRATNTRAQSLPEVAVVKPGSSQRAQGKKPFAALGGVIG